MSREEIFILVCRWVWVGIFSQHVTSLLLLHPTPLPDEWLGSWLFRLAEANALPLPKLLELLNLPPRERWKPSHFKRLEQATGHSDLAALWTPEDQLRPQDNAFLHCGRIRFCPECLRSDPAPYIRRQWLRNTYGACTTHQVKLESTCPHCQKHVRLIAPRLSPEGATYQQYEHPDLRRCVQCGGDLSDREPQPFAVESVNPPSVILQKPMFGNDWDEFEHAIRLMSATFRLDMLLSPAILHLTPLGQLPPRMTQEDAEHLQLLISWLLKNDGLFVTLHQRLRSMAAALTALIDQQAELPEQRHWMYLAWLLTRLRDDTSEQILMYWPTLVHFLCKRLYHPPKVDIPSPSLNETLLAFAADSATHAAYGALLTGEITYATLQQAKDEPTRLLHQLEQAGELPAYLTRLSRQQYPDDPLRKSDAFIELTRRIHPSLHRSLVFSLGVKFRKGQGQRARKKAKMQRR